jgi:transposase-like protein
MNLSKLRKKYGTQKKCIKHLEKVRWEGVPVCPYCRKIEHISKRANSYRYQCNNCGRSFSVLVGTIFENTNMELPTWFMMIAIMVNSKMGTSSKELSRLLGITQRTAWYNAMKVRCAMLDQAYIIDGIAEMDEAYIGGKPRKPNSKVPSNLPVLYDVQNKRGRGTRKVPVVGVVSRGKQGKVIAKVIEKFSTKNLLAMLKKYVNKDGVVLITDEFSSYKKFDETIQHLTIDHKKSYAKGAVHTNTIEGFWSLIKNGIKGNYRAVSKKYLPFYLAEYSYKYNHRNQAGFGFDETMENAVDDKKCLVNFKPKGDVKKICYNRKRKV